MSAPEDSKLRNRSDKEDSNEVVKTTAAPKVSVSPVIADNRASQPYINQWNQLVSTTNWEKGRIICAWRDTLVEKNAPPTDYSDESWANLVGGVTGQHVGRLRRVYQKFATVWPEYPGLFWSHFQVGMDWDDAEMWLEGAIQNGWSVSQMRAARWEAHGAPASQKPREEDILVASLDEDALPVGDRQTVLPTTVKVRETSLDHSEQPNESDQAPPSAPEAGSSAKRSKNRAGQPTSDQATERKRPFANLPELPDDVADAFEQFKLVILSHRLAGWTDISREDLLASLDALKELAMLPADD